MKLFKGARFIAHYKTKYNLQEPEDLPGQKGQAYSQIPIISSKQVKQNLLYKICFN